MRKLNSLNVACLLSLLLLSACGMPGPLYQTPEQTSEQSSENTTKIKMSDESSTKNVSDKTVREN